MSDNPLQSPLPDNPLARAVMTNPVGTSYYGQSMGMPGPFDPIVYSGPDGTITQSQLASVHQDRMNAHQQVIAAIIGMAGGAPESVAEDAGGIVAYHGTPHEFDRFDTAKIGTGEGAQAYGHGLYFAENPGVAGSYAKTVGQKSLNDLARDSYDQWSSPQEAEESLLRQPMTDRQRSALLALKADDWLGFDYPHQAINAAIKEPSAFDISPETASALSNRGSVLTVRINANPEDMLDWDKPLSEQSPKVQDALARLAPNAAELTGREGLQPIPLPGGGVMPPPPPMQTPANGRPVGQIYGAIERQLGSPAAVSAALSQAGIKGIRYLDQGSRNAGDWTIAPPSQTVAGDWMVKSSDYNSQGLHFKTEAEARAALAEKQSAATYNNVVFDHNDVAITHRNGVPVAKPQPMTPAEADYVRKTSMLGYTPTEAPV